MPPTRSETRALALPLKLERIAFEKVWGGRSLERTPGIRLELEGPVGETWELVDRDDHNSRVEGGPHAGRTLRSLLLEEPEALLGDAAAAADGSFPVLVKLLSASQPLSVQVHPDDATARRLGAGTTGKTECWYVLAAEPESSVQLGLAPGVDAARLAADASCHRVADMLRSWPVEAGQFVFVPAGTLHSIGAGVTLVEVQQNSDITFRLYDWDRVGLDGRPREVQLEEALLSIDYEREVIGPVTPRLSSRGGGNRAAELVDCEHFRLELLELEDPLDLDTGGVAVVYVVTRGRGRLSVPEGAAGFELAPGDTWLVPAELGAHRLEAVEAQLQLLRVETKARA
jgi:mannose-6-phosphate isomerase